MGRRKIKILPITDDRNRSVTFLKRKNGLFKKAYELGVLCNCDVAVIIFGANGKLYEYASGEGDGGENIDRILLKYSNWEGGAKERKGVNDFRDKDDSVESKVSFSSGKGKGMETRKRGKKSDDSDEDDDEEEEEEEDSPPEVLPTTGIEDLDDVIMLDPKPPLPSTSITSKKPKLSVATLPTSLPSSLKPARPHSPISSDISASSSHATSSHRHHLLPPTTYFPHPHALPPHHHHPFIPSPTHSYPFTYPSPLAYHDHPSYGATPLASAAALGYSTAAAAAGVGVTGHHHHHHGMTMGSLGGYLGYYGGLGELAGVLDPRRTIEKRPSVSLLNGPSSSSKKRKVDHAPEDPVLFDHLHGISLSSSSSATIKPSHTHRHSSSSSKDILHPSSSHYDKRNDDLDALLRATMKNNEESKSSNSSPPKLSVSRTNSLNTVAESGATVDSMFEPVGSLFESPFEKVDEIDVGFDWGGMGKGKDREMGE